MALKDYFYFTKDERRGVVALVVIIALLFGVRMFIVGEPNNSVIGEPVNRLIEEPLSVDSPIGRITDSPKERYHSYRQRDVFPIELNSADTLLLQELKGVGPGFARRIVKYREKLGGYYAKEQLMEVYGFTDSLYKQVSPHVTVDASKIQKLNINELGIAELKRHPYISFFEAKAIVEYRNSLKSGRIENLDELAKL
ncbi:MAG: helix-hairpin-helix domain-containing protein, partial [Paludibacteraceae bacterium]|nr:helix-hairpin-helix domain-containing protein [Paludibacteraceae bacterium]